MNLDQISQEEQEECDQLTQGAGDHLRGASRRHASAGDDGRGRGGGASERHGHDVEAGARERQQGGGRDFRGNGSGRGGGPNMGGRGGPAAAAPAAAARANEQPDGPIKDVLTAKLKDLLCADNLERFRRVSWALVSLFWLGTNLVPLVCFAKATGDVSGVPSRHS